MIYYQGNSVCAGLKGLLFLEKQANKKALEAFFFPVIGRDITYKIFLFANLAKTVWKISKTLKFI